MAAADTARLIASLELQDKFTGPARGAESALDRLEGKTRTLGRIGDEAGRGLGNLGRNLAIGAAAGVGVIAASVTVGLQALVRLEEVEAATNAVIESTGGIANITAERVRALAEEYESLNATIDDKVIQSAENLLLTFTNVGEKAFEPALEAALNLNQALGGGEAGLQGNLIIVGKALNDPIRGLTALRRVGVGFSQQQEDQIKLLVEQNDLYGAQQVILDELTTQFGGQFAAAGDTAAGKFAKLKDVIEDSQMALATAFLPVLEKTADKLGTFLADPGTQKRIAEFSETLAGGLDDVISFVGQLPWAAIGSAFEIAGAGARAVLDAFRALPPWIQTAVLTGWGLNKLTGGALGNIAGTLVGAGIDLFKGRGTTPANPLFVKDVGLPGAPGGPGGGGKFPLVPVLGALTVPLVLSGSDNPDAEMENKRLELTRKLEEGAINAAEAARLWAEAYGKIVTNPFVTGVGTSTPLGQFNPKNMGGVRPSGMLPDTALNKPGGLLLPDTAMRPVTAGLSEVESAVERLPPILNTQNSRQSEVLAAVRSQTGRLDMANVQLAGIRAKVNQPPIVNNNISLNVGISATLLENRLVNATITKIGSPTAPRPI